MMIDAATAGPDEIVLPGASRATIVLGFASFGGLVGFVVATMLSASMLGLELPDRVPEFMPSFMMAGAGIGWVMGVSLGGAVGYGARGAGPGVRRLANVGAAAVAIGAVLIVVWPVRAGWPDTHVEFFHAWHTWGEGGKGGPAFVAVTVLDAFVAAATLLVMGRDGGAEHPSPRPLAGAIGVAGLLAGGTAFVLGMALVPLAWPGDVDHLRTKAVYRTTESLVAAAAEHEDRTGEFPSTLEQLLAAGGKIRPRSRVEFLGESRVPSACGSASTAGERPRTTLTTRPWSIAVLGSRSRGPRRRCGWATPARASRSVPQAGDQVTNTPGAIATGSPPTSCTTI